MSRAGEEAALVGGVAGAAALRLEDVVVEGGVGPHGAMPVVKMPISN